MPVDDFTIPPGERGAITTQIDVFEEGMLRRAQNSIVNGTPVYKYLYDLPTRRRMRANLEELERVSLLKPHPVEANNMRLIFDGEATSRLRAEGRISEVSDVYLDIGSPARDGNYNLIERFDPAGNVIIHEGVAACFNQEAARRYSLRVFVDTDSPTRSENYQLDIFTGRRYKGSNLPLSTIMQKFRKSDTLANGLHETAKRGAQIIVDDSRPIYSPEMIGAIFDRKLSALEWNFERGRVDPKLYGLLKKYFRRYMNSPRGITPPIMTITKATSRVQEHIDRVFDNTLLHMMLDDETEEQLSEPERLRLKNEIDSYIEDPPVSSLVRKARREEGIVLFLAPLSEMVIDAAIMSAREAEQPLILLPSRNQIESKDLGGGYVEGWDQRTFVNYVMRRAKELDCQVPIYFNRDHGGPWQRDEELAKTISVESAMSRAKQSLRDDLLAGFSCLHIDASRSPFPDECEPDTPGKTKVDIRVERTIELIAFTENSRRMKGLPAITYEVGGEQAVWN